MYVCTLGTAFGPWLIRVDCATTLMGSVATYTRTNTDGEVDSFSCPIGPDSRGEGLPTLAVRELLSDMQFADIGGSVMLVLPGPEFGEDDLVALVAQMVPSWALLQTSAVQ